MIKEKVLDDTDRVNRGGSWRNPAVDTRFAYRGGNSPANRGSFLGFRVKQ